MLFVLSTVTDLFRICIVMSAFEFLALQFWASAPMGVVLTFSSSLCRCVWWESQETTSYLTRPRPSSRGLIMSRAARPPLGSQFKGQTSEMTAAMGAETLTGPPGAAGESGSSPETGLKRLETAPLSRGTLSTLLSCRLLMFFWE